MKLEEIKTNEEEKLTEQETVNLFNSIVLGKDVTEVIKTSRGDFKVKYPRMKDLEAIGRKAAIKTNGIPVTSFDSATYNLIQQIAALDVLVLEGPAWFQNAKRTKANFGFGDIPDQDFIQEVYTSVYTFRYKVQEQIRQNQTRTDTGMATEPNNDTLTLATAFDGLSS